uniref:Uncharacterized protein n=1 Tax=Physcomitrium patens TaxID=3218 RepID=A0A2K1KJ54_PHYPA|nr:hypothetical protein PHYPA_007487 [Physcomitrium patens]
MGAATLIATAVPIALAATANVEGHLPHLHLVETASKCTLYVFSSSLSFFLSLFIFIFIFSPLYAFNSSFLCMVMLLGFAATMWRMIASADTTAIVLTATATSE